MSNEWGPQDPTAPRDDLGHRDDQPTQGHTPPGYSAPGYTPPGYQAPGYQAPGYSAPSPHAAGPVSPTPPPPGQPGATSGAYSAPTYPGPSSAVPSYPPSSGWGGAPLVQQVGIVPLRPLDLSTMLGGAFRLLRFNTRASVGLAFAAQLVGLLVVIPVGIAFFRSLDSTTSEEDVSGSLNLLANLGQVPSALITWVATLLLSVVVSRAVIGERITIAGAWREAKGAFWRYVGLGLLSFVGLFLLVALLVAVLVGAGERGLWLALPMVPLLMWLWIRLAFAPLAIVLERSGVTESLSRSWALTQGQFWRITGIKIVSSLIISVISSAVMMPIALIAGAAMMAATSRTDVPTASAPAMVVFLVLIVVLQLLVSAFTAPVSVAVDTLLYIDQRIRREGLDVQLAQVVAQRHVQEP